MSPIGSYVRAITSKWQVGVLLWEHRGWMLHMAFSYKAKNIGYNSMLSSVPTYSILLSTIFDGPPSLQRGKRAACFPFVELLNSYLYTREHSALFLQSLRIARYQESVQDSCRPMSLGSYRPANLMIRTDSKQGLRPLPFLSRTGNVLQAFLLQDYCILNV